MADNLLDKASILLTPTAYDNGSMLSVKPENGDGDFTFSRNGAASRVNSSSNIVTEGTNLPRINYENGIGSWLLEQQSTNLVTYSEDFSQWNNTDITIGANGTSPSGETNANLIQTGSAGSDQVNETFAISATNTATYSVFIKRVSGAEWVDFLVVKSGFSNSLKVWFNIKDGLVGSYSENGTTTFDNASVKDFGNGWYRLQVTTTDTTNNTAFNIRIRTASADNTDTRFDNSSYYLWAAQLENQPFATSYIPTDGAANTRIQDIASNSGNASLINSTEGVLYAEIKANAIYNLQRWISLSDGSHNNAIKIGFLNSSTDLKIACEVRSGGVSQAFMVNNLGAVSLAYLKVAVKYKENDFALWINGVEVDTDTSGSAPIGLNNLTFTRGDSGQPFFGKAKALAVYKEALTDEQLTAL
jgi:hypothetical protein